LNVGRPKPGDTVVSSAGCGAVGSVVGQIANIKGTRVVGIAGNGDKCAYLVQELGFDAAVNRSKPSFSDDLKAACPEGVDIYFENAGGAVMNSVVPWLHRFGRVPMW